jgi:hypothetical protein
MFLIDISFKGCQGRSNCSSTVHAVSYFACGVNETACTVHAVSMRPHVSCMRCQGHRMHRACGINETACTVHDFYFSKLFDKHFVHAESMTPHAPCMRYHWHRMHFEKFEYLREFEFIFEMAPLIRSPGRMFWWKKPRVENLVTLSL